METPQKKTEKVCCFCFMKDIKKLVTLKRLTKTDCTIVEDINVALTISIPEDNLTILSICQKCRDWVSKFANFKKNSLTTFETVSSNIERDKRLSKTPQSQERTQKRRKGHDNGTTTIEWLQKSVEKMRIQNPAIPSIQGKARKCLILTETSTESKLPSTEHSYALPSQSRESKYLAEQIVEASPIEVGGYYATREDCKPLLSTLDKFSKDEKLSAHEIAFSIFKCTQIQKAVQQLILKNIESSLQTKFQKQSILYAKNPDQILDSNLLSGVVIEMNKYVPFLQQIMSLCCHGKNTSARITMIATIFAMMMQSRDKKMSAIQRMYTTICLRYHADNMLLNRLNVIHLTLSEESKRNIVKQFGNIAVQKIISEVRAGKDDKINGDNLDIRVNTGDMRMSSRDMDYHFFASDWTPDRVDASALTNDVTVGDPNNVTVNQFLLNTTELDKYKTDMKILIAKEFVDTFPAFKWMDLLVPKSIPHDLQSELSAKSKPCLMPVQLKNEIKYSDCIDILSSYQDQAKYWYREAGREEDYKSTKIPIGGDQLTRIRLQGAKLLRAGTHTFEDRFDNLTPMVVEFFHIKQDFLQKLCKVFLKLEKSIEQGTLSNLKVIIHRSNINGQVKVRFKAHEDFILTAGKAYLTELALEHFQMDNTESIPTDHKPPDNVSHFSEPRRRKAFDEVMGSFVDKYITPFNFKTTTDHTTCTLQIKIGQLEFTTAAAQQSTTVRMTLIIGDQQPMQIKIPVKLLEDGKHVSIPLPGLKQPAIVRRKPPDQPDDLRNYVFNFLQWYFTIKYFKDAIKQGDIVRTNISLKLMIPHFYNHSKLSKYLVECLDYILKTEILLSPQMALRVRAGSFVNRKGKPGKNKAADLEKENQVKFLKDLIRGLGKGKTEKAVVDITKAGPVFLDVCSNFENMSGIKTITAKHKSKSSAEDLETLYNHLREIRPFRENPGRHLKSFRGLDRDPFKNKDEKQFDEHVMKICDRLKRNEYLDSQEEEGEVNAD